MQDLLKRLNNQEIREFIRENRNLSPAEFMLKYSSRKELPLKDIAEQIECTLKAEKKLPELSKSGLIYKKISLEQASSEITAKYKSSRIKGKRLIDLTGGLGIDSIYFSNSFNEVVYCEMNNELAEIADNNFKVLGINNITVKKEDGIKVLKEFDRNYFDWIYADPSRRDDGKRSVDINYYSPDVLSNMNLFLENSENICLKLAPAFDIKEAVRIFPEMNEFSVVSVRNECKEVLIYLSRNKTSKIKTAVILNEYSEPNVISGDLDKIYDINYGAAEKNKYFLEPDAAVRKSGLSHHTAEKYKIRFINPYSDYLISEKDIQEFQGRRFVIVFTDLFSKKKVKQYLSSEKIMQANISRSNFPLKPEAIKQKLKLKDGGDDYLFFTKNNEGRLIFIHTRKID